MNRKRSIAAALSALLLCTVLLTGCGAATQNSTSRSRINDVQASYETRLFDPSRIHTIDITFSDTGWKDLRERAVFKKNIPLPFPWTESSVKMWSCLRKVPPA